MLNLRTSHPEAREFLVRNGFTASLADLSHSNILIAQVIEMTINRSSKETVGLSGKLFPIKVL